MPHKLLGRALVKKKFRECHYHLGCRKKKHLERLNRWKLLEQYQEDWFHHSRHRNFHLHFYEDFYEEDLQTTREVPNMK